MPRRATPVGCELSRCSWACLQEDRLGLQLLGHRTPAAEPSWWEPGWLQGSDRRFALRLPGPWDEPTRVFFPLQSTNCRLCLARSLVPEGGISSFRSLCLFLSRLLPLTGTLLPALFFLPSSPPSPGSEILPEPGVDVSGSPPLRPEDALSLLPGLHQAEVAGRLPAATALGSSRLSRGRKPLAASGDPRAAGTGSRLRSRGDGCEAPAGSQQERAEPQLSSRVGVQGDGAADGARWVEHAAFGPGAKSRRHEKRRLCFSKGCNSLSSPLRSPNLLLL